MGKERVHTFSLPSTIDAIDGAVVEILKFAEQEGFSPNDIFGIDMAARESVTNAVKHGNKLDPAKPVEVSLWADGSSVKIEVRDRGEGFNPDSLPDPTNPENLLKASGRGILFMKNFMDEVAWRAHPDGGTVVSLRKSL